MSKSRSYTNEDFINAVKGSLSVRQVLTKLKLKPTGGNYKQFNKRIQEFNLDISHFTGQAWNVGERFKSVFKPKPLCEILVENSTFTSSHHLRKRLLKEKIKDHKCESCNKTNWMNVLIPLELEHINGITTDNRIDNLKLLCPNCHALTPTWRRRKSK